MKILKKTGRLEDFDIKKIECSIKNSARDCGFSLIKSDITNIINLTKNKIELYNKRDRIISSYELKMVLYNVLIELGFRKIADVYIAVL